MPDLTTEYATACETQRSWETTIIGSTGTEYTVRWERLYGRLEERLGSQYGYTCTCKGFQVRLDCKHVRERYEADKDDNGPGLEDRCGWDSRWHAAEVDEDPLTGEPRCPCCGGPTFTYAFGA